MTDCCANCLYSLTRPRADGTGTVLECHRFPPVPTTNRGTQWPEIVSMSLVVPWCGEWRPRELGGLTS